MLWRRKEFISGKFVKKRNSYLASNNQDLKVPKIPTHKANDYARALAVES
jgi:hypothetical protein